MTVGPGSSPAGPGAGPPSQPELSHNLTLGSRTTAAFIGLEVLEIKLVT